MDLFAAKVIKKKEAGKSTEMQLVAPDNAARSAARQRDSSQVVSIITADISSASPLRMRSAFLNPAVIMSR